MFLPLLTLAQKSSNPVNFYPIDNFKASYTFFNKSVNTEGWNNSLAKNFIEGIDKSDVELVTNIDIKSNYGEHYSFDHYINGIQIYRAFSRVNAYPNRIIFSQLSFNDFKIKETEFNNITVNVDADLNVFYSTNCFFPTNGELVPAKWIKGTRGESGAEEYIFAKDGLLYFQDLNHYLNPTDTTIFVSVFNPDPVSSSGNEYGAPYIDNNDSTNSALENEIFIMEVTGSFDSNTFILENDYVRMKDLSIFNYLVPTSSDSLFSYNRFENEFEDCNVFYHVTNYKEYLISIGLANLPGFKIDAFAHGLGDSDQSLFNSSATPPRLMFGDGGVDDGEDADVIVHEFGHALSFGSSGGTNSGGERKAIDEGLCDYIAASYSFDITPTFSNMVFTWDGHNEYWNGRNTDVDKIYPDDLVLNLHMDGEIWSSALVDLHDVIGRENTDKIMFESMSNYSPNMSMTDAAWLMIQADSIINNGLYYNEVYKAMDDRGFFGRVIPEDSTVTPTEIPVIELLYRENFATGGVATVKINITIDSKVSVYDAQGKLIIDYTLIGRYYQDINSKFFVPGAYFVVVETDLETSSFQLIKL